MKKVKMKDDDSHEPNETTRKALKNADKGKSLTQVQDLEDLLRDLER